MTKGCQISNWNRDNDDAQGEYFFFGYTQWGTRYLERRSRWRRKKDFERLLFSIDAPKALEIMEIINYQSSIYVIFSAKAEKLCCHTA